MTKSSKTVLFFGSGPVAKASLDALIKHTEVEAVVTKPQTLREMTAGLDDTSTYTVNNRQELSDLIASAQFESSLGIIVDFGIIVEQRVIDAFGLGIINSHFSLLPEWRGADPISYSVLSGQAETGVSLMLINAALDEGQLLAQQNHRLRDDITTPELTDELVALSNDMLKRALPLYFDGKLRPYDQDASQVVTYSRRLAKEDGQLDWRKPAGVLEREVRAFAGWPKSAATLGGIELTITRAHAENDSNLSLGQLQIGNKILSVGCGSGKLIIDELKPAGKNKMPAQAFLAGYGNRFRS